MDTLSYNFCQHDNFYNLLGPVPQKMVKFNPGLSQISSMVFLSKNMKLELTKHCLAFTPRYSDDNTKCYSKKFIAR